jgi:4'-phosphopantetheinyl transferase
VNAGAGPGPQDGIVDCYRLDLSACDEHDLALLDSAERERAARFRFDRDRIRYVAAHAQARRHLGARLDIAPAQVPFTTTRYGKPILAAAAARMAGAAARERSFCFNLTHSGAVGYLAISSFSVGIDVELHRSIDDLQPLIDSYCSAGEIASLAGLPIEQRCLGFLGVWTRKEAALKAWGTGIGAVPLNELHVGTVADAIAPLPVSLSGRLSGSGRGPARYPGLRLKSIASAAQVLSIAAATDQPLTVRIVGSEP